MNINALLDASTPGTDLGLKNKLTTSASAKDFSNMFDNVINKFNDRMKDSNISKDISAAKDKDFKSDKTELKSTSDVSDKKIDKVDNTKDDSKIKDKDEDKDTKAEEAMMEVLQGLLELLKSDDVNIEDYIETDEDGNFKINMSGIEDLTSKLKNLLGEDKMSVINEALNSGDFDFEDLTKVALNFVTSEANLKKEMPELNMKPEGDMLENITGAQNLDSEITTNNDTENVVTLNNDNAENNTIDKNAETKAEGSSDNFEKLKNTIDELINKIEVTKKDEVTNQTGEELEIAADSEISADDLDVTTDEKSKTLDEDLKEGGSEKIDTTDLAEKVNNETETGESSNGKESKEKDNKKGDAGEKVQIRNAEPNTAFDGEVQNNFENLNTNIEIQDVKAGSQNITDRFLETVNVAKQMVKGVELSVSETSSEMSIKLDPENLGKVNLKVITENGLVMAKFEVESQRVKEIIESNLSLLKESLENKGVSISGLEVSVGQDSANQNAQNNDLEYMRKIASGKNPHKILGKTINKFNTSVENNNSQNKVRGLYMTKSKVNYIA